MGPQAFPILYEYWDRLRVVACVRRCYVAAFKVFRGVIQGNPLYPIIFNVVVITVVRHWILLLAGGGGCKYRWGREVQHRSYFFHADDGLFVLNDPVWLQGSFDTPNRLFVRVGLQTNIGEKVGIFCRPCLVLGTQ